MQLRVGHDLLHHRGACHEAPPGFSLDHDCPDRARSHLVPRRIWNAFAQGWKQWRPKTGGPPLLQPAELSLAPRIDDPGFDAAEGLEAWWHWWLEQDRSWRSSNQAHSVVCWSCLLKMRSRCMPHLWAQLRGCTWWTLLVFWAWWTCREEPW
jgi:hypothetical protein